MVESALFEEVNPRQIKKYVAKESYLDSDANDTEEISETTVVTVDDNDTEEISETTVVTAYFSIPSKHSGEEYEKWMKNCLSLQDAMIIFTTADMVPTMETLRVHAINRTHIVHMELSDVWVAKANGEISNRAGKSSEDFWKEQLEIDPERERHQSYELFWIWLSKTWFVNESIHRLRNPFSSSVFFVK